MKEIQRLLAAFPSTSQADPALVLHNFLTAVDDWSADYVEDAVSAFIKGQVPGFDGRFAPTPAMLGAQCRVASDMEARRRYLDRLATPALPPPDIKHSPEEQARARAKVAEFIAAQGPSISEQRELDSERRASMAKHDSFFAADFIPTEGGVGRISKSLAKLLGYSIGAPESEENAA